MSVCLSYPASKSYLLWAVLYFHPKSVWLYHILPHYLTHGTILEGRGGGIIEYKIVFWFSLQLLSEKFLILSKSQWDIIMYHKYTPVFKQSTRFYCQILIKF